ncbi:flagellar hook-associated protein FlgL [Persephonella sp. IF05-L8]|uniref:flagellar hook-associated protein FlgL n=1 Tax=Persephonella sp. IF05-L8 TaxID=1158338 RepID=UPI0006908301
MRVPDISFFDTFIKYDRIREKDIERYTQQLASGKKILTPSDNIVDNVRSLRFKKLTADLQSYNRNIDLVKTSLDIAESTLRNIVETGQELRVDIVNILNTGVLDYEDAQIYKDFFQSMRDYIIKQANVTIGDTRIFGGVKSQVDPFDERGIYQGEFLDTTVPVAKGVELNTTFIGKDYLGTIPSGVWVDTNSNNLVDTNEVSYKIGIVKAIDDIIQIIDQGDISRLSAYFSDMGYTSPTDNIVGTGETGVFTISYGSTSFDVAYDDTMTLSDLVDAINSNPSNVDAEGNRLVEAFVFQDKDGVYRLGLSGQSPDINISVLDTSGSLQKRIGEVRRILDTFDKGFEQISQHRSMIGTQINVADNLKEINQQQIVELQDLISKLEDADYAGTIAELEKAKTAYEALLASISQNKDLSLLKYFG